MTPEVRRAIDDLRESTGPGGVSREDFLLVCKALEAAENSLYADLCRAVIRRILSAPDKWIDPEYPHDILLRLECYIRRAERLEDAEARLREVEAERDSLRDELTGRNAVERERIRREITAISANVLCSCGQLLRTREELEHHLDHMVQARRAALAQTKEKANG